MRPKVSIIIPVYKVEKYIERCVRTLFGQTLDSLEFIFVDDCSPDNSIELLKKVLNDYPNRLEQVKIIRHEVNKGVGKSRQDGVDAASGEYIIHCDPDDWVELDMYEKMYTKATDENVDVVICDYYENFSDSETLKKTRPDELTSLSVLANITGLVPNKINGCLWNKLMKRELYNTVSFIPGVYIQEDDLIWVQLLDKEHSISYIDSAFYHYWINRQDSLMKSFSKKTVIDNMHALKFVDGIIKSNKSTQYQDCLKAWIGAWIIYRAFPCKEFSNKDFTQYFSEYDDYCSYSKEFNTIKLKLVKFACNRYHRQALFLCNIYQAVHRLWNKTKTK